MSDETPPSTGSLPVGGYGTGRMSPRPDAVVLERVTVVRDGRRLLDDVSWRVGAGERWVVLGPNGAGKTTLLQVVSTYLAPTKGTVTIFGERYGRVDARELRRRVGYAGPAPSAWVRGRLPALEVVVTGKEASFVEARWRPPGEADWDRAMRLLERVGAAALADRRFDTLSAGERQRVLLARSLMADPDLLLLDEATTGLDLGAREAMVAALGRLAADPAAPACVLVTHHVEEIPPGFDRVLLLSAGRVVAAGPIATVLDAEVLSATFSTALTLERREHRWRAWAASDEGAA